MTATLTLTPMPDLSLPAALFPAGDSAACPDYLAVASAPGLPAEVRAFSPATAAAPVPALLAVLHPFEASFTGGVRVAMGDLDSDGVAELIVTPDAGGSGRTVVYEGADLANGEVTVVANFYGVDDPNYRGGAVAAVGDVDGDGRNELLIGAETGGGPRVRVYAGIYVVTAPGGGDPGPEALVGDFFAGDPAGRSGVELGVVGDAVYAGAADGGGMEQVWRVTADDLFPLVG